MIVTVHRRSRRLVVLAAVVLVAVLGVVLLRTGSDGGGATSPADRLESLDVDESGFVDRWNRLVTELGAGDELTSPSWAVDEALGLERCEQSFGDWGLLELYRRGTGTLVAVDLVGAHVSDADRARFRANAAAAVAATAGLDPARAVELVDHDLGLSDASFEPSVSISSGGITVTVDRTATSAELRVVRT